MQQGSCSGQDVHGPWEQGFGGKKDGGEDLAATRIWREQGFGWSKDLVSARFGGCMEVKAAKVWQYTGFGSQQDLARSRI